MNRSEKTDGSFETLLIISLKGYFRWIRIGCLENLKFSVVLGHNKSTLYTQRTEHPKFVLLFIFSTI